ncbi:hypothetical protein OAE19_07460 [Porticoccaceae bacterium]|nr:hypothetical protein [Porticoccaceae bacterium]
MTLRDRMQREQQPKSLYEQAQNYAFEYADEALARNVFPSGQALSDLRHFDEGLPENSGDAKAILDQLHQYGSPASVALLCTEARGMSVRPQRGELL